MVYKMSRSYYMSLAKGGVKIYEYKPGFVHSKMIIVDDYMGYSVAYGVAHQEKGWNGPFVDGFLCEPDEIELIEKNRHEYK